MPILLGSGADVGAGAALGPDRPFRLILLDLTGGRTLAIAVFSGGPLEASELDEHAAEAMPIIESLEFHPPTP